MRNKVISIFLVIQMTLCMLFSAMPVFAAEDTITISTTEEFLAFSKNCTLDVWSEDKKVELVCDLDFSDTEFVPIAVFDGEFNGNGHTLSGITLEEKGSYKGVFRYVNENGRVFNLNIRGKITPGGSKSFVGGIVGENSGVIEGCTFVGTVKGENVIGGIVGHNTETGKVISCISSGTVTGENHTGGIVGKNSGFIQECVNNCAVNTSYEERKNTIDDLDTDTGAILESYINFEEQNEEESALGHTDTGGITGYSSGIVQGCENYGTVGHQHIGYNVGGIAGRQSGYMLGCKNYGTIKGRKDVGGIAGQAEPYIILNTSQGNLENIKNEINALTSAVNKLITDTDEWGNEADIYLSEISSYAKTAQASAEELLNSGTDFVDDNIAEINAQSAILSNTLDKLGDVFDDLIYGGKGLADGLEDIADALDSLSLYAPNLKNELNEIEEALAEISKAEKNIENAVEKIDSAKNNLKNAFKLNDEEAAREALEAIGNAVDDIIEAQKAIKTATEDILSVILSGSFEDIDDLREDLEDISEALGDSVSALETLNSGIKTLLSSGEIDFSKIKAAAKDMGEAAEEFSKALSSVKTGLDKLASSSLDIVKIIIKNLGDIFDNLDDVKDKLADGFYSLSFGAEDIRDAMKALKKIIDDLADEKPLEFVKLGDDFKDASENLFSSLSGINGELDKLRESSSDGIDKITSDLSSVNNRFNSVLNLIIGELEDIKNGEDSLSDIFVDASDENIESTKQGKIDECVNFGEIEADRNTGGIAGAMAVEYSIDPEDELEKPDSLKFSYESKAVLQGCVNEGKVTGKKDCTGGIVGLSELGTVYECENYADVESTGGNYVGAIAGKSAAQIHKSYSKSAVTGKRYVGGIAGKGNVLTSSYAICNVSGDESLGAVCGEIENLDNLYHNFYVDNGLGALDGISYKDKAESIDFWELKEKDGIPSEFINFSVTFIADGNVVERSDIKYGDSTKRIRYPEIPEKEGYFGNWEKIDGETVTENIVVNCIYEPYITVLSSVEKNESGKLALALCEGEFTDKAVLHISLSDKEAPTNTLGVVKVYDVSILNTDIGDTDTVNVRILNENKDKVTAWRMSEGKWEKIKTTDKGKYVIVEAIGSESTFCLKFEESSFNIWIALIIVLAVVIVILIKSGKIKFFKK